MDSVTVTTTPQLLQDLAAARGFKGDSTWRNVTFYTDNPNSIYMRERQAAAEAAPDGSKNTGIPMPSDGLLQVNAIDISNVWVWVPTGGSNQFLYIVEDDFRSN